MKCECCHKTIQPGEEQNYLGRVLCEDCYLDALSPLRTCDPWAVHSAKSFEKHSGGSVTLTPLQSEILRILEETGGVEPDALLRRIGGEVTHQDLERAFSSLRHMEKARGEKQGQKVIWRLW